MYMLANKSSLAKLVRSETYLRNWLSRLLVLGLIKSTRRSSSGLRMSKLILSLNLFPIDVQILFE